MTEVSIAPAVQELERLYALGVEHWLQEYIGHANGSERVLGEYRPLVVVSSRGRKAGVDGWYTPGVWEDADEAMLLGLSEQEDQIVPKRAEIVIASEVLSDPVQATAELMRQALRHAHQDLSPKPGSYYYSQQWVSIATRVKCIASVNPDQPSKGWSVWTPTKEFKDWANSQIRVQAFTMARDGSAGYKPVGSRMKKWHCECTTVRCAVELRAVCDKCKAPFRWAESKETSPFQLNQTWAGALAAG